MMALNVFALAWWALAMLGLLASFAAGLFFPRPSSARREDVRLPPLTAIVPIKSRHFGFEEAQDSLFAQHYPDFEVMIAAAETGTPAWTAAQAVAAGHPGRIASFLRSSAAHAASPKLNTLWAPLSQARHDLVLTKDSNIVMAPDDLESFVRHMGDGVGLVSAIPVAQEPRSAAAWVEAAIVNGSYARLLMLGRALGIGVGCGKIMLFRRSDIDRAGGLPALAWALGEDAAMARMMTLLGLKTVLADRFSPQPLGVRSPHEVWQRQLRWKSIWRVQVPVAFAMSLLNSALLAALAGALAAPLLGLSGLVLGAATLCLWAGLEFLLSGARGWPLSLWAPAIFLGREGLDLAAWFWTLTAPPVVWAGASYRAGRAPLADTVGTAGAGMAAGDGGP